VPDADIELHVINQVGPTHEWAVPFLRNSKQVGDAVIESDGDLASKVLARPPDMRRI
jgi:hypothetical protein